MNANAAIREKHDGAFAADRANVRLWLRLLSCTTVIEKRVRRRFTQQASTLPRFDVMAALDRHPEGMTMGELSRSLLVSNGNVTGLIKALVSDGLAEMDPLPSDRRTFVVRLTPKGQSNFLTLAAHHNDWIDGMFARLSAEQRDQLFTLLGALKSSIALDKIEEPSS